MERKRKSVYSGEVGWRPDMFPEPKAEDAFKVIGLKWKILEDKESREKALMLIDSFLQKYEKYRWAMKIYHIGLMVREELRKSMNVLTVQLVKGVIKYITDHNAAYEKKKAAYENDAAAAADAAASAEENDEDYDLDRFVRYSSDEEEYEEEEQKEKYPTRYSSDEDLNPDEDVEKSEQQSQNNKVYLLKFDNDDDDFEAIKAEKERNLRYDAETRDRCIQYLRLACSEHGMSAEVRDEGEILNLMIPYILGSTFYFKGIMIFLGRVKEHIDRCCTVDNLETVETALKYIFAQEDQTRTTGEEDLTVDADDQENMALDAKNQVNELSEERFNGVPSNNMVPTTEDDIMNQIKQEEKRECGDVMEIEEERETLNLPEVAKDSTGNAYSCIRTSLERAGANKRKIAQV